MEEKVSVIIPVDGRKEYLKRCISSVKRQSYGNVDIILINSGRDIKDIIESFKDIKVFDIKEPFSLCNIRHIIKDGISDEKIMFVASESVLSENVISRLVEGKQGTVSAVSYSIYKNEDNIVEARKAAGSIYGKMFFRNDLIQAIESVGGANPDCLVVLDYYDRMNTFIKHDDAYIYDNSSRNINVRWAILDRCGGAERWLDKLDNTGLLTYSEKTRILIGFVNTLPKDGSQKSICISLAKRYPRNSILHSHIARLFINKWHREALEDNNVDAFKSMQSYLRHVFVVSDFRRAVNESLGIGTKQFFMLKVINYASYRKSFEYKHTAGKTDASEPPFPIDDFTVSDQLVKRIRQGKIGLRPLANGFMGWIDHKIKQRNH